MAPLERQAIAGCLFVLLASACTDVGDSSNGNGDDGSTAAGDDTGSVLEADGDATIEGGSPADATLDSAQGDVDLDGAVLDASVMGAEAGTNSGLPGLDATAEAGGDSSPDARPDTGAEGGADSGGGGFEAGVDAAADAGPDAGIDANVVDAAPDAPGDAGALCDLNGSASGACTPTEALFAAHSQTCIEALFNAGCLDDTFGDTGNECTDAPAGTTPSGVTRTQACLDVIRCTLAHSSAQPVLAFGYCGVQPSSTSCATATPGQTGPCLAQEQDGEESIDPVTVLSRYTSTNYGGGVANKIFNCAIVNLGGDPTLQACLQ